MCLFFFKFMPKWISSFHLMRRSKALAMFDFVLLHRCGLVQFSRTRCQVQVLNQRPGHLQLRFPCYGFGPAFPSYIHLVLGPLHLYLGLGRNLNSSSHLWSPVMTASFIFLKKNSFFLLVACNPSDQLRHMFVLHNNCFIKIYHWVSHNACQLAIFHLPFRVKLRPWSSFTK